MNQSIQSQRSPSFTLSRTLVRFSMCSFVTLRYCRDYFHILCDFRESLLCASTISKLEAQLDVTVTVNFSPHFLRRFLEVSHRSR